MRHMISGMVAAVAVMPRRRRWRAVTALAYSSSIMPPGRELQLFGLQPLRRLGP